VAIRPFQLRISRTRAQALGVAHCGHGDVDLMADMHKGRKVGGDHYEAISWSGCRKARGVQRQPELVGLCLFRIACDTYGHLCVVLDRTVTGESGQRQGRADQLVFASAHSTRHQDPPLIRRQTTVVRRARTEDGELPLLERS